MPKRKTFKKKSRKNAKRRRSIKKKGGDTTFIGSLKSIGNTVTRRNPYRKFIIQNNWSSDCAEAFFQFLEYNDTIEKNKHYIFILKKPKYILGIDNYIYKGNIKQEPNVLETELFDYCFKIDNNNTYIEKQETLLTKEDQSIESEKYKQLISEDKCCFNDVIVFKTFAYSDLNKHNGYIFLATNLNDNTTIRDEGNNFSTNINCLRSW